MWTSFLAVFVALFALCSGQFEDVQFTITSYYNADTAGCSGLPNRVDGAPLFAYDCTPYGIPIDGYYKTACNNDVLGIVNCTEQFCANGCGPITPFPCDSNTLTTCCTGIPTQVKLEYTHEVSSYSFFGYDNESTCTPDSLLSFTYFDNSCQYDANTTLWYKYTCDGTTPTMATCKSADCSLCTVEELPTECTAMYVDSNYAQFWTCPEPTPAPATTSTTISASTTTTTTTTSTTALPTPTPNPKPTPTPTSTPTPSTPSPSTPSPSTPSPTQTPSSPTPTPNPALSTTGGLTSIAVSVTATFFCILIALFILVA